MSRSEQSTGSEGQQVLAGNGERRGHQREGAGSSHHGNSTQHGQQAASGQRNPEPRQHGGRQPRQSGRGARPVADNQSVPTGFRLISFTFTGVGLALLAGAAVIMQGASAVSAFAGPLGSALLVVGLLFGALGVGHLTAGYGTWRFRPWGRRAGLFIAVGSGLGSATVLLMGSPVGLVGVLMHGAIAWYLHANRRRYTRLRRAR